MNENDMRVMQCSSNPDETAFQIGRTFAQIYKIVGGPIKVPFSHVTLAREYDIGFTMEINR